MSQSMSLNSQNKYEIKIFGQLNDSLLDWFGEANAHVEVLIDNSYVTTFSDVTMDQAGLVGLIRRLHGRGIVLISIRQVELDHRLIRYQPPDKSQVILPVRFSL